MPYTRICIGCNNTFDTENANRKRCTRYCGHTGRTRNPARTKSRDEHHIEFIGVDGEGVTQPDGTHDYVLFSVGAQSLHRDGAGLCHDEIFEFLYCEFLENPDAAFVGFFLGYDFTQWAKTLPASRGFSLLHRQGIAKRVPRNGAIHQPWPVRTDNWEFDLLGDKRFKLRPYIGRSRTPEPWMYVCDAGPFFQTSFLSVLDPDGWPDGKPPIPEEQYRTILEGKKRRADAQFDTEMIRYNVAENAALSTVMGELNRGFVAAGVRLKRNQWFGPGQAAAAWLNDHCNHRARTTEQHQGLDEIVPRPVMEAARASYYGGWFEIFAHGHIPGLAWEYDINSAYPAAIAELPCLLHGTWSQDSGRYALVRAHVTADSRIMGALPCRNAQGQIFRGYGTEGWYWRHELDALARVPGLDVSVVSRETWAYTPCPCPPPLREVRELYQQRIELGEKGKNSPAGKALKLLYNSMYGKLAQSVGQPMFSNPVWASMITSHTRTAILDAIATHPHGMSDLLMVATDAVYFRTPHGQLTMSPTELGAWDGTERQNMTLFLPGIYWDDKTRQAIAEQRKPKLKSRGLSASALALCIGEADAAFTAFDPHTGVSWPQVEIPLPFSMVSARQAITRGDWNTAGQVSTIDTRVLDSFPITKRNPASVYWDGDILRCEPYSLDIPTVPYSGTFGMDPDGDSYEVLTPDGDASKLLYEYLK